VTSRARPDRHATLSLYLTGEHPCSYIPGLSARSLFVDPLQRVDAVTYQLLLEHGFRRSGGYIYRPGCDRCRRCVSLRIPVREFAPSRSQRRNRELNARDVTCTSRPASFEPEHFRLYDTYLQSRHPGGSMADATPASYTDFLVSPWGGETRFLELRLGERLMAVAVTDVLPHGLSAVYTFFEPGLSSRAPGTYAVLCQIDEARRQGLDHLYLGYWIEESRKMSYKDRFRPTEAWMGGTWQPVARGERIPWRENGPAGHAS
jgi:arginyl-tRNA--protein-N-Asp/Glu arginylyltransferase